MILVAGRRNLDIALGALIALRRRDRATKSDEESLLSRVLSQFSEDDQAFFENRLACFNN